MTNDDNNDNSPIDDPGVPPNNDGIEKIDFPHTAGPDIIRILVDRINASSLGAVREAISNGYDAESKKVWVRFEKNALVIEDWGTGILDVYDFGKYAWLKKEIEGKKNGKEKTIGKYHMGKLSYLKFSDTVVFLSNNGDAGYFIKMNIDKGFETYKSKNPNQYLDHQGTKIIIENPRIDNIEEFEDKLWVYLVKTFSLKTLRGYQLKFGKKATSIKGNRAEFEPEEVIAKFGSHSQYIITGKLEKGGAGSVMIYSKDIYVGRKSIDAEYNFSGYVNCDPLTPLVARNDFLEDQIYLDFVEAIKKYVKRKFERRKLELTRSAKSARDVFERLANAYLKQYINPLQNPGKGTEGNEQGEKERRDKGNTHGTKKPTGTGKTRKPKKKQPSESSLIVIYDTEDGDEKPPMYSAKPNVIWWNRTHSLTRFCQMMAVGGKLGSVNIRYMFIWASSLIELRNEFADWSYEEREAAKYEAVLFFLREELLTTDEWNKVTDTIVYSEEEQDELDSI